MDHLYKLELNSLEIRLWIIFCSDGGRKKKNQYPEFYQERLPLFGEKYGMIQFQSLKHILFYGILYTQLSLISN